MQLWNLETQQIIIEFLSGNELVWTDWYSGHFDVLQHRRFVLEWEFYDGVPWLMSINPLETGDFVTRMFDDYLGSCGHGDDAFLRLYYRNRPAEIILHSANTSHENIPCSSDRFEWSSSEQLAVPSGSMVMVWEISNRIWEP